MSAEAVAATEKIPFAVEISRMIEVLAAQIYPSPFALLRENVQNSFDAILMRTYHGHAFDGEINLLIEPTFIRVADNGIGMSRDDLRSHFWRAGASSKNTPGARAAGVVGTRCGSHRTADSPGHSLKNLIDSKCGAPSSRVGLDYF